MAILVGVMAPQLIKYIEKSNVSADTQLCDTIRTAITTTMLDPEVINSGEYKDPETGDHNIDALDLGDAGDEAVFDILGITDYSELKDKLKSKNGSDKVNQINIVFEGSNRITIYIPNSCAEGKKGNSCSPCHNIGSGPDIPARSGSGS